MITDFIQKMIDRMDLTEREARAAMEEIMAGMASDAQIAGFLTALRMKGEAAQELIGFARVMREKAEPLWDGEVLPVLDTAGAGGGPARAIYILAAARLFAQRGGARPAEHS